MSSLYDVSCFAAGVAGNIFRPRALPVASADIQEGGEGQIDGAVRWAPLPALPAQLLHLPLVRPPLGLRRRQDPRRHRQRHRRAVPARLHFALHLLRRQQEDTLKITGLLVLEVLVFALIAHASIAFFDQPARQLFVGSVSMGSLVCMSASPLAVMGLVIRTECVEFMPFYLSLSTFLMSVSFAMYGLLLRDFFIYFPNGIGVILGAMQLVLYAYYSRKWKSSESSAPLLA